MAFLELNAIEKAFDRPVLRGVTLEAATGEMTVILGPSGSGKSTLLRLISGLASPDGGTIRLGDRLLSGDGTHVVPSRRNVGYVFQEPALPGSRTPIEILTDLGAADEAVSLLREVHLPDDRHAVPAGRLSGGESRRVALARALGVRPRLLLLDEPFSGLEPDVRRELGERVRHLARNRGFAVLHVTHLTDEAFRLADRLAILYEGSIRQVDAPEVCYRSPRDAPVARMTGPCLLLSAVASEKGFATGAGFLSRPGEPSSGPGTLCLRPSDLVPDAEGELRGRVVAHHRHRPGGAVTIVAVGDEEIVVPGLLPREATRFSVPADRLVWFESKRETS